MSYFATNSFCVQAAYLFDNEATVFFAGFMALWAVLFLEFWKRRQFQLQHNWDVLGYEAAEVSEATDRSPPASLLWASKHL